MTKKSLQKLKYHENKKSLKAFFIIFKGLLMKQTTQFFLDGESPTLKSPSFLQPWRKAAMLNSKTCKRCFHGLTPLYLEREDFYTTFVKFP